MKTIDFSYFIERYLAGEMSEAEKLWFLKELDGNENLRKEVELRKNTDAVLRNQDVINLRGKLHSIEMKRQADISDSKPGKRYRIGYTVAAGALLISVALVLFTTNRLSDDEILDQYYKTYEVSTVSRAGDLAPNTDYDLAIEYYRIHDFKNAAIYFNRVLESEPGNMHSALLNGVSNFEISNYPEANKSFVRVINDNNNLYIDHAQWYLALCYIKTGEREMAVERLMVVKASKSVYSKDASRVLKALKNNI